MIRPRMVIFPGQSEWWYVAPTASLWRVIEMEAAIWRWRMAAICKQRLDEDAA